MHTLHIFVHYKQQSITHPPTSSSNLHYSIVIYSCKYITISSNNHDNRVSNSKFQKRFLIFSHSSKSTSSSSWQSLVHEVVNLPFLRLQLLLLRMLLVQLQPHHLLALVFVKRKITLFRFYMHNPRRHHHPLSTQQTPSKPALTAFIPPPTSMVAPTKEDENEGRT